MTIPYASATTGTKAREEIIKVLHQNSDNAQKVVRNVIAAMPAERTCKCGSALRHAILTDRTMIPSETKERLRPILGKYLGD